MTKSIHKYQWKLIRKQVLSRDGHSCTHCGASEGKMEVDHIIPRHRGGDDTLGNLQTLCTRCHQIKTKKDASFLVRKGTPPYHISNFSPRVASNPAGSHTKAIEGDSDAFGLG
jgi:5-methylcytosine-specific restriction endonuclease McrA